MTAASTTGHPPRSGSHRSVSGLTAWHSLLRARRKPKPVGHGQKGEQTSSPACSRRSPASRLGEVPEASRKGGPRSLVTPTARFPPSAQTTAPRSISTAAAYAVPSRLRQPPADWASQYPHMLLDLLLCPSALAPAEDRGVCVEGIRYLEVARPEVRTVARGGSDKWSLAACFAVSPRVPDRVLTIARPLEDLSNDSSGK